MEPKVAIVSGGSRGLGQAIVSALLGAGYRVATFSRSKTDIIRQWEQDQNLSEQFLFRTVDATDRTGLRAYIKDVHDRMGRIDVLVNNVGLAHDGVLALYSDTYLDKVIDVNLKSLIVLTRACVRIMLMARSGRIVSISSILALRGYNGLTVYSASKAAIDGFTRSLAREIGPRNITVNAIAPGYLRTEMTHGLDEAQTRQIVRRTPLGRLGEPCDVVPLVPFLCSDEARFITGQTFVVDGGLTC